MRMPVIKVLLICLFCCTLAGGCRRKQQAALSPVPADAPPIAPQAQGQTMELRPLGQLTANEPTHVAVDSLGNVYWTQEGPQDNAHAQDILFVSGKDEIPRPTGLTTQTILAAFGPPPAEQSSPANSDQASMNPQIGNGNIQSIAIDGDDQVLFFFNGGIGRSTRVCVGRFNPRDQSIHLLADTQTLAAASQMEASIELAQGQIIKPMKARSGEPMRYWLWLHHSDKALFFRFDLHSAEPGQQIELSREFDQLSGDGAPANLASNALVFSAGDGQTLLMVDRLLSMLWRVDENGVATKWTTLMGLPRDLSALTARPGGIVVAFAPVGQPAVGVEGDGQSLRDAHFLRVQYPAVLAITPDNVIATVVEQDIHAPPEFDIANLKFQQLIPAGGADGWLGYDLHSGVLFRIQFAPKN
jgi:hypothetical protein